MTTISNSWIKKEKLPKVKKVDKEAPKHIPTVTKSNMQRTLLGTRK